MRRTLIALIFVAPVLFGQTAKRQVHYSSSINRLTKPSDGKPEDIAFGYLTSSANIASGDASSVYLAKQFQMARNGVTHFVYRQRFQGIDVENGAWVVNVGADGAVLSSSGTLYPAPPTIDFGTQLPPATAVTFAAREVNPRLGARYVPSPMSLPAKRAAAQTSVSPNEVRFEAGDFGDNIDGRMVWYAHRGTLLLAWLFNIVDEDGVSSYDVAVEASTGAIIAKHATTFFQTATKGLVFDQGWPQPNPTPGVRLNLAPPTVDRKLLGFGGDPVASPMGWVANNETAGYNAIVGENLLGQTFLTTAYRTQATGGNFSFPLSLGPIAPNPLAFTDAANVNLFYWVNRAHDLFYGYGFDEAAGNFQSDNYGRGGVGGDAMLAYTHYGAAAPGSPSLNNAFFTTRSLADGAPSMVAMFATFTGAAGYFADGAYAADVIVHEYTHGVSIRLLPDGYGSFQTAAMGEAWSDFFSLEFTTPQGAPADGSYPVGEYWIQSWGTGIRTRPYSTQTVINPITYADLGHVILAPEVHADGEIWTEALWEARAALIQQLGEVEGRRRMRQLVIDGLILSPPSPTMVDARDAILLADQVDFEGTSQDQLWGAFAKRGLGALAFSDGGDTIHVISSTEVPSTNAKLKFHENTFSPGEPLRLILSDANLSAPSVHVQLTTTSGDAEDMLLSRVGSIYVGIISSSSAVVARQNAILNMVPGDTITASYNDADSTAPVQTSAAVQPSYALAISTTTGLPTFPAETRLTNVRAPVLVNLPFDFPFFAKKYHSMVVLPTGAIMFEPSVSTNLIGPGCNDRIELSHIAAIAPLFVNLTFGSAQPSEGIYMSSPAPNTIAIRWTAETLPTAPLLPPAVPEPVNFAATMTSDGVITFYYGAGNQNLHTAVQTLSTCGAQPTVGISPGHDAYVFSFPLRTYNNAQPVTLIPPFNATTVPEVTIERPAANDTVRGIMRVSGIAYDTAPANFSFITRRDIFIDGVERAVGTSVSRPDFCTANTVPGCPLVGFQADINLPALNLSPGAHTIFVRATNSRGATKDTDPVSFNVDGGQSRLPKGAIEAPAAGAELSGTVQFRGYAYADDLRVVRVDLLIDGLNYPSALYGLARADICGTLPAPAPPSCPNIGWSLTLNTRSGAPPLPDGPHSMQLRVQDELGRFTLLPDFPVSFTVKNGPQTFPVGAITSIKPSDHLTGVVSISGYAYSPGGRVLGVVVVVDGSGIALAQSGQPRPVECANLPQVSACPNIGFSYDLDTRTLTNGDHVIGVSITNDSGLSVIVPTQVRGGMNVTIDNK
jgi:Fungalysin metallopeptidase (M36)/Fungalysin/Thermolysin Propeptide Motif